jgi:ParB family transcriptional regulator, chromosome partitioning protein
MTIVDKRKALGRGLDSLLPSRNAAAPQTATPVTPAGETILQIPIDKIERNPYQTRTRFDETALAELAASIKASGVLQPIVVRHLPGADHKEGKYQLIAGERRWLASQKAGRQTVPAMVKQVSNEQAMEMTIIENLQREDLNPIEQAMAFDRLAREFNLTQEQMAQKTGKDRSSVSNYLRLLKMPPEIQTGLGNEKLTFGHAKALMMLDTHEQMLWAATRIVKDGLSVRQAEELVHKVLAPEEGNRSEPKLQPKDPNVRQAEQELQRTLGLKVRIQDKRGKGKIVIEYASLEDFDRVLEVLSSK